MICDGKLGILSDLKPHCLIGIAHTNCHFRRHNPAFLSCNCPHIAAAAYSEILWGYPCTARSFDIDMRGVTYGTSCSAHRQPLPISVDRGLSQSHDLCDCNVPRSCYSKHCPLRTPHGLGSSICKTTSNTPSFSALPPEGMPPVEDGLTAADQSLTGFVDITGADCDNHVSRCGNGTQIGGNLGQRFKKDGAGNFLLQVA